jgi:ASC-1-like (ASCH) protein
MKLEQIKSGSSYAPAIKKEIDKVITPLYGDQEKMWQKVMDKNSDRICYAAMTEDGTQLLGVLIFKSAPSNEYKDSLNISESVEIKTLFVIDRELNGRHGVGSKMLEKAIRYADQISAAAVHVTVSDNAQSSLSFFQKKGFRIVSSVKDKYIKGVNENILTYQLQQTSRSSGTKRGRTDDLPQSSSSSGRTFDMFIKEPYLSMIRSGRKTVEGRINSGQMARIQVGDILEFKNHNSEPLLMKVVGNTTYQTFHDMLTAEGVSKCLPNYTNLDAAVSLYRSLPGFREKEIKFGVVAFRISRLSDEEEKNIRNTPPSPPKRSRYSNSHHFMERSSYRSMRP